MSILALLLIKMALDKDTPWSKKEDCLLKEAVKKYGTTHWSKVSYAIGGGRTPRESKERWAIIKKDGGWTKEEEEKLNKATIFIPQWSLIGGMVGKTGQECYEKYKQMIIKEEDEDQPKDNKEGRTMKKKEERNHLTDDGS